VGFSQHVNAAVRTFLPSLPSCATRPHLHLTSEKIPKPSLPCLLRPEEELTTAQYDTLQTEFAANVHAPAITTGTMLHASGGLPYLQTLTRSQSDMHTERPVTFYSAGH
jgi:hypothetical protein